MVNVSHYADNGRSLNKLALILFILFEKLFNDVDLNLMLAEYLVLHCDILGILV